jgi:predicted extracellular nuclease
MVDWIDEGGDRDIPMVILGDFNSRPGDDAMKQYEDAGFVYVRNESGEILDEIDHIMYRPAGRWQLLEADKPTQYTASDHDAVWATLQLLSLRGSG